jgi:hypothetical protein
MFKKIFTSFLAMAFLTTNAYAAPLSVTVSGFIEKVNLRPIAVSENDMKTCLVVVSGKRISLNSSDTDNQDFEIPLVRLPELTTKTFVDKEYNSTGGIHFTVDQKCFLASVTVQQLSPIFDQTDIFGDSAKDFFKFDSYVNGATSSQLFKGDTNKSYVVPAGGYLSYSFNIQSRKDTTPTAQNFSELTAKRVNISYSITYNFV